MILQNVCTFSAPFGAHFPNDWHENAIVKERGGNIQRNFVMFRVWRRYCNIVVNISADFLNISKRAEDFEKRDTKITLFNYFIRMFKHFLVSWKNDWEEAAEESSKKSVSEARGSDERGEGEGRRRERRDRRRVDVAPPREDLGKEANE